MKQIIPIKTVGTLL